ncbi:hypothetical protein ACFX1Q_000856 [Malus domestica]
MVNPPIHYVYRDHEPDLKNKNVNEERRTELAHPTTPVHEIMEWMDFRKMEYSKSDYAIRVDITAKVKGIEAAEDYVSGLPESSKDLFTYSALMRWYCKELMEEKALALFATMDELGCASSTFIFNSLMSLHMRKQNSEKVDPLVQEMKKRNIPLDKRTYKTWMQSYAALEDFEALGRVLDEMKTQDGKKGSWSAYSNLADIYVKAELFDKADEVLKTVEKLVKPLKRRKHYYFLISLYACTSNLSGVKKGMHEEAELILSNACKKTKGKGSFLEAREMLMVHALNTRKVDLADSHLGAAVSESKDGEWHPSPDTRIAFLKYFEDEKDVDGAEKFCKILKRLGCLSCNEYCLLLKTYIAAGKSDPAMRQRLKEEHIEISPELELENLLEKVSE